MTRYSDDTIVSALALSLHGFMASGSPQSVASNSGRGGVMSMVERVARVIRDGLGENAISDGNIGPRDLETAARAVLRTLREPSEAMCEAAGSFNSDCEYDDVIAKRVWTTMIRAALEEKP